MGTYYKLTGQVVDPDFDSMIFETMTEALDYAKEFHDPLLDEVGDVLSVEIIEMDEAEFAALEGET